MKIVSFCLSVYEEWFSLFHDQKQGAVITDAFRVESGWQDSRIFLPGAWQKGHVRREGAVHSDNVGVSRHRPWQHSEMPAHMEVPVVHVHQRVP